MSDTRKVQLNVSADGMQGELAGQVAMLVNQSNVEIAALHSELAALKARVSMLEASLARSNAT